MQCKKFIAGFALAALAAVAVTGVQADEGPGGYPNKPIRLVVPFLAGGATDQMARGMAQKLAEALGQPVIVDNKAGAGGSIGAEAVANAAKDGYTLLYSTMGVLTINPSLYPNLKYDPATSFAPVGLTHVTANLLVVNPQVPAKSVAEPGGAGAQEAGWAEFQALRATAPAATCRASCSNRSPGWTCSMFPTRAAQPGFPT